MQKPEPKPTTYAGVTFRSRLEARWAVFLDAHFLVNDWLYEPRTYRLNNGWEYTPDFLYTLGDWKIYLEIKPELPNEGYLAFLCQFAPVLGFPLFLAYGSFYKETPRLIHIGNDDGLAGKPVALEDFHGLPVNGEAIKAVKRYRFDLREQRPTFRNGSALQLQKHIHHWNAKQRGKIPPDTPPPSEPQQLPPKKKPKRRK